MRGHESGKGLKRKNRGQRQPPEGKKKLTNSGGRMCRGRKNGKLLWGEEMRPKRGRSDPSTK